jgi:CRP/FNR family transcriptional regulator, anaerobic regulatory protein
MVKLSNTSVQIKDVVLATMDAACSQCALGKLCFPGPMPTAYATLFPLAREKRIRLARGDYLFRAGERQTGIYAVKAGFLKSCVPLADGQSRIVGFQSAGDVLGFDGLGTGLHRADAIAMNGCEVCVIALDKFDALLEHPTESAHVRRLLSQEITRIGEHAAAIGILSAKQRVATFLLELSEKWEERGYSKNEFVLFMSRKEIGNFLGLTFETVSRTLSYFQSMRWITVQGKKMVIRDLPALRTQVAVAA